MREAGRQRDRENGEEKRGRRETRDIREERIGKRGAGGKRVSCAWQALVRGAQCWEGDNEDIW